MNDLPIVYESEAVLAVVKPAGMVVHPGPGIHEPTLVERLAADHAELKTVDRLGLVHRLDKGTSGIVLIAKTPAAKESLSRQFADRTIRKRYVALVRGVPADRTGVIDAPITRHHADRKKMAVRPDGRGAETRYAVSRTFADAALLDVFPKTGRTHQIRVHLTALGHPIVGDATYGVAEPALGRPFLHAAEVTFEDPATGQPVTVTASLPDELETYLDRLEDSDES